MSRVPTFQVSTFCAKGRSRPLETRGHKYFRKLIALEKQEGLGSGSLPRRRSSGFDRHPFLPHKRLLNRVVENSDQSQHASRSAKCTLDLDKLISCETRL